MTSISQQRPPARTLGFNHVNLVVTDVDQSVAFYRNGLGLVIDHQTLEITFMTTPGTGDSIALQLAGGSLDVASGRKRCPGDSGGVDHLGFDVASEELDGVVASVVSSGGEEIMRLDGASGLPTVFVTDLDGYVLQLTARKTDVPAP